MSPSDVDDHRTQAPTAVQADDDGASSTGASNDMAKVLEMLMDLKGEMGARLERLETRRDEDDRMSMRSAGSSTFRAYAEARAGLGRRLTITSLEEVGTPAVPKSQVGERHRDPQQEWRGLGDLPARPTAGQDRFQDNWGGQRHEPHREQQQQHRALSIRDLKVVIESFSGDEVYAGLGAGFGSWGRRFLRQMAISEQVTGVVWPDQVKLDLLGRHLTGQAARYFNRHVDVWFVQNPSLWYALDRLNDAFTSSLSKSQALVLFTKRKDTNRTWKEHLLYLEAVGEAVGGADELVLESIVQYASPELRPILMGRYDPQRPDFLRHAEELAQFAQRVDQLEVKGAPRNKVAAVGQSGNRPTGNLEAVTTTRACYKCGSTEHLKRDCPNKSKGPIVLAVTPQKPPNSSQKQWILDSGSSWNLVTSPDQLHGAEPCDRECLLPNSQMMRTRLKGSAHLKVRAGGQVREIVLCDVYYAENLPWNVISYGKLEKKGYELRRINGCRAVVRVADGFRLFDVECDESDVLVVNTEHAVDISAVDRVMAALDVSSSAPPADAHQGSLQHIHERLGHLAYDTIELVARDPSSGIVLTNHARPVCVTCAKGKQTRQRQSKKDSGQNAPIDRIGGVICSDIKGPITPRDRRGNRYMINFIDHNSNYCRVFLAKTKDQATKHFEAFIVYFEKRFSCKIHCLRTDGGREYRVVDPLCKENGIRRQVSEAENQASNGKAERMHQTIMNMVRSMIFGSSLPLSFWGDAAEYAAYVLNRSPTRANPGRASPLEILTGIKPKVTDIVAFGSPCTAIRTPKKKALSQRAEQGIIVGKSDETKGYQVMFVEDRAVRTTQHVQNIQTLSEASNAQLIGELSPTSPGNAPAQALENSVSKEQRGEAPLAITQQRTRGRRGSKGNHVAQATNPTSERPVHAMQTRSGGRKPSEQEIVSVIHEADPKNYREAMKSVHREEWLAAMKLELDSLKENDTWELVARTKDMRPLHTKWVYKSKTDAAGNLDRRKARTVACGNEQEHGESYNLTFAAVMDMTTGRVVLVLARIWAVPARHGDVPNAYVKAKTEDDLEILICVPQGMEVTETELRELGVSSSKQVLLRLKRSLYGLKQAGRLWNQHLHNKLIQSGFVQCVTDTCLYFKADDAGMTVIGIYVDDLLITGTDESRVDNAFFLLAELQVKDLGRVSKFLGMRVTFTAKHGYELDQEATINALLAKEGLQDAHAVSTPIEPCHDDEVGVDPPLPKESTGELPSAKRFQSVVGSLLWLARCTRPDIAFAVHKATRRAHAPKLSDWRLVKRVMRYLKGTKHLKLKLGGNREVGISELQLESFSDADFAGDKSDHKSVSGALFKINDMVIGWLCKKQTAVALSTMEAECVAAAHAARELLGMQELLEELGFVVRVPMMMYMDNQAAIRQIENEESSAKAKHIDIKLKFTKDYAKRGVLEPEYVSTDNMPADLMTKAFAAPRLVSLRKMCSLMSHDEHETGHVDR